MPTTAFNTNFSQSRVLVVGDIMLDRYWTGDTNRISPEAPVPVVTIKNIEQRAGGAGNVALNIASLGGQATVFAQVGKDEAADELKAMLTAQGILCHFSCHETLPTAIKLRILSRHQQLIRADFEETGQIPDLSLLLSQFEASLTQTDVVILSDYGKGVLQDPQPFIQACQKHHIPVLVDPKGNDFSRYAGASLITPNRSEFEAVVGACSSDAKIIEKAQTLIKTHRLHALLITLSEEGMLLITEDGTTQHLPTKAREVFDVTGAGDTVIATFAAAIGAGLHFNQAMEYANLAAGVVVAKLGTSTVSQTELQSAITQGQTLSNKIIPQAQLKSLVQALQQRQQKIVMTNGCFDILHAGHVSYLQAAKNLGDRLIVAVNTDASVQRLKGDTRPIQSLQQRMELLAALESVDFVVSFSEDTPEALYCDIVPDVLVKGGDYDPDSLAGADCIKQAGGQVEVLHFVKGQSTSAIVQKIKTMQE